MALAGVGVCSGNEAKGLMVTSNNTQHLQRKRERGRERELRQTLAGCSTAAERERK